jgi:integrase
LRDRGIDPIEHRKAEWSTARLEAAKGVTFREAAAAYIAAHRAGWRNEKHAAQWPSSLEAFVYPTIGHLPAQAIDTGLVLKVLEPIWTKTPETASRVRGRIESVLSWAAARGYRDRSSLNPATWKGHLDHLLPARTKVRAIEHHPALPYAALPGFMAALRAQDGIGARALEFTILTAARSGEVLGARWSEIDLGTRVWTVPAARMKGGREHRVPLSDAAVTILKGMAAVRVNDHVFPGRRGPPSGMTMTEVLRRLSRRDITVHGMRSTFRDWCGALTNFPREVAERALAHRIGDAAEQAYARDELLQKRRKLMDAWAAYCARPATSAAVVPMRATR